MVWKWSALSGHMLACLLPHCRCRGCYGQRLLLWRYNVIEMVTTGDMAYVSRATMVHGDVTAAQVTMSALPGGE